MEEELKMSMLWGSGAGCGEVEREKRERRRSVERESVRGLVHGDTGGLTTSWE